MARKKRYPEINFSIIYYLTIVGRLDPGLGTVGQFPDQLGDNTICHPNQRERTNNYTRTEV